MLPSSLEPYFAQDFITKLICNLSEVLKKDFNHVKTKFDNILLVLSKKDLLYLSKTSKLNCNLRLFQEICNSFSHLELYKNRQLSDLIISNTGIPKVGDSNKYGEIIDISVSSNFGVNFIIRQSDGKIITHEFYD